MDNKSNRTTNFFRREGFYVLLFVCICIVATVAAISAKNKTYNNMPIAEADNNENIGEAAETYQDPYKYYEGAMEVDDSTTKVDEKAKPTTVVESKTVPVAATNTEWAKPVVGKLARAFSLDPVKWESSNTWRPNNGVDIQAAIGSKVYSVLDGVVLDVKTDEDGVKVIIDHQNGFKTVYSNLDEKVTVKKGTKVKRSEVIGYVGKTTLNAAYEKYGDHLHFEIIKDTSFIDPAKYISKYL